MLIYLLASMSTVEIIDKYVTSNRHSPHAPSGDVDHDCLSYLNLSLTFDISIITVIPDSFCALLSLFFLQSKQ